MVESRAEQSTSYLYVPPRAISDNTRWRSPFLNGAFAARWANSIILIICIHNRLSEEGRIRRKSCAVSMRLLQSATFVFCTVSSSGPRWGSFGGMNRCSMTECRISESRLSVVRTDMAVENKTVDTAETIQRQRYPSHVYYSTRRNFPTSQPPGFCSGYTSLKTRLFSMKQGAF